MAKRTKSRLAIFEELFSTHYAALFALGYGLSKNRELTKDEIQRFFLELWEKKERLPEMDSPLAYLRKSFARQMLKTLQKQRKKPIQTVSIREEQATVPSYETLLIDAQEQDQKDSDLNAAIQRLPTQQREMLNQRFLQGLSYEEIALKSGKSKQTVYNQIYEAIKKLKKSFFLSLVLLPFM